MTESSAWRLRVSPLVADLDAGEGGDPGLDVAVERMALAARLDAAQQARPAVWRAANVRYRPKARLTRVLVKPVAVP